MRAALVATTILLSLQGTHGAYLSPELAKVLQQAEPYDYAFGKFGIGDVTTLKQGIKNSTEAAITAYLKANFDLED